MIGLKRKTVALLPHDVEWETNARETIGKLWKILGRSALAIEHVGSTAIRSICAKPIIDIAVGLRDFADIEKCFPQLAENGFIHRPSVDTETQRFLSCGDDAADTRTHHIHAVIFGEREWCNYINFRDYMNAHSTDAAAYESLKRRLCGEFALDRESYTSGKGEFIARMLTRAEAWSYLGSTVEVKVDRPLGSRHPKFGETVYPLNYGYIDGTIGGDGEGIDVYVMGVDTPIDRATLRVIGMVRRENDCEDKLIAAPDGVEFSLDEMTSAVEFQERYFASKIERFDTSEITNVFDNAEFFDGYARIRANPHSANEVEEKPALRSLLPSLYGKSVLDLGCGMGESCGEFISLGASRVVGVDISRRMLDGAALRYPEVEFVCGDMSDLSQISGRFDVVTSSLALHYVRDLDSLFGQIHSLLNDGGLLIFSQEHPLTTAPMCGASWTRDESGAKVHYNLADYSRSGRRVVSWMVDGIVKYHRRFSDIVNSLTSAGFVVEKMLEPYPNEETLARLPEYLPHLHKPNFLVVRARKA